MFDATETEYPIRLHARDAKGREHEVVHVFGPIDEPTMIEYQRRVSRTETKRNKLKIEGNATAAALWLWNKAIVRVENYGGKKSPDAELADLMTFPNWKDLVAPPHKVTAANKFYEVWTEENEEELSASSPLDSPSAASSS